MTIVRSTLSVDASHPSLAGHFPGAPVVPGVLLLGLVVAQFEAQYPMLQVSGIRRLKFIRPLFPDQLLTVEFHAPANGEVQVRCVLDGALLAEARLTVDTP
jgi:3-hydroxymyristoyl/3-hydroxydecanoyl-(acyl carrier protein) dehydratase